MPLFDGKRSKLVLYNYDSFLIDYCPSDGKDLLLEFVKIVEAGGQYPVRIKYGENYEQMAYLQIERGFNSDTLRSQEDGQAVQS